MPLDRLSLTYWTKVNGPAASIHRPCQTQGNSSQAHNTQVADGAWPLEYKLPSGDAPPLLSLISCVVEVVVNIHH